MAEKLSKNQDILSEIEQKVMQLEGVRKSLVDKAYALLGAKSIRYVGVEGGMNADEGFDCSGFVNHTMGSAAMEHGVDLYIPRHANELWREFGEPVVYGQRQAGDLVFFPSKQKAGIRLIGHVGIVAGKDSYIHAPGKNGTVVCRAELPENPEAFEYVHPKDIYTHSPAGIKRITLPIGNGRWHVH